MSDYVLVLTTVPAEGDADTLARTLVTEQLVACVNVLPPMVSTYRWKGSVERDHERQVIMKTTRDRVAALRARVKELHSYEVPEFVVIPIQEGSEEYLRWIRESTRARAWGLGPLTSSPGRACGRATRR
jgi:periplasmic divalent cation tolerance protein